MEKDAITGEAKKTKKRKAEDENPGDNAANPSDLKKIKKEEPEVNFFTLPVELHAHILINCLLPMSTKERDKAGFIIDGTWTKNPLEEIDASETVYGKNKGLFPLRLVSHAFEKIFEKIMINRKWFITFKLNRLAEEPFPFTHSLLNLQNIVFYSRMSQSPYYSESFLGALKRATSQIDALKIYWNGSANISTFLKMFEILKQREPQRIRFSLPGYKDPSDFPPSVKVLSIFSNSFHVQRWSSLTDLETLIIENPEKIIAPAPFLGQIGDLTTLKLLSISGHFPTNSTQTQGSSSLWQAIGFLTNLKSFSFSQAPVKPSLKPIEDQLTISKHTLTKADLGELSKLTALENLQIRGVILGRVNEIVKIG